ncbi:MULTISPECIES: histidine-type phosphatase [unclassified Pseudomonas]|uniref:histidine-type phosphatase n=1 Tax=unclassified Pseudomonas TaxID=196821 RepID=UPI0005BC8CCE|nr:histidine-type phosphatase [Pseudomonas sp. M47T1]
MTSKPARSLWLVLSMLMAAAPLVHAQALDTSGLRLDKVVLVMRHGVRPATDTAELQTWSAKPWPTFAVADGQLTAHGYRATVLLGQWQRDYLKGQGLFTANGCPSADQVYLQASPAARTRATGKALLEGMFPGCTVPVHHGVASQDQLFHPSENGLGALDPQQAEQAILAAMGGSPQAAQKRYGPALLRMQQLVGVPHTCDQPKGCVLSEQPWGLKEKGSTVKLSGPLSMGASMAETIRMQYAEGLPLSQVAFGHARNAAQVAGLMELRSAKYALTQHVPYIARRGASQLLHQVLLALDETGPAVAGGPPSTPWLAYVGHDGNIAQLRTLLGFDWNIAQYPRNDAAPGGTLLFERWLDPRNGQRFVSVAYVAQSLDQLRQLSHQAPYRVQFTGPDGKALMPLATFEQTMGARIDSTATQPQAYADD